MLKRLSIVLAATAVMGVCMAMMPQKVEAIQGNQKMKALVSYGSIQCYGYHYGGAAHGLEPGVASAKGQKYGGAGAVPFTTASTNWYQTRKITSLREDLYTVTVKGRCGRSNSASSILVLGYHTTRVRINY
jgi:hypothetical protein